MSATVNSFVPTARIVVGTPGLVIMPACFGLKVTSWVEVLDGVAAVAISKTICWMTPLNQRNLVDVFIFNFSNLRHEFFGDVLLLQRARVRKYFLF
jgi:hypothetical protein